MPAGINDRSARQAAGIDVLQTAAVDRRADSHADDGLPAAGVDCRRCVRAARGDYLTAAGIDDRPARRAAGLDVLQTAAVDRRADSHAVDVLLRALAGPADAS